MAVKYYTDNFLSLSFTRLWKLTAFAFPVFALRKMINWRFKTNSAQSRPEQLNLLDSTQLPPHVADAIKPLHTAALQAGLHSFVCYRKPYIGGSAEYVVVLVDPIGLMRARVVWSQHRIGQWETSQTAIVCQSRLKDDRLLETACHPKAQLVDELFPPWIDLQLLPSDATPEHVISEHRRRIENRIDVIPNVADQLMRDIAILDQLVFDYLVSIGMLVPVNESEVRRLLDINNGSDGV